MRSRSDWIPPQSKHPIEVVPVTPAELAALKAAGNLDVNVTYEVPTSEATGNVVHVYATTGSSISHEADYYDPALSDQPFPCHYDCGTDRIDQMWDPIRDVEVHGSTEVNNFPWGNTSITETKIDHANFTYTAGTIRGLIAHQNARVIMGGGDILEVTVGEDSALTQNSGYIRYSSVDTNSTVVNNGTLVSNTTFADTTNAALSGGTLSNSSLSSGARLTQSNGAITETTMSDNCNVRLSGTGRIYYSNISSNGLLYADNWAGNFYYNDVSNVSQVSLDGSGGNIQRNTFSSNAQFFWRNGTADFYYNSVSDNATADFDNSTGLRVRYNSLDSGGFVRIENATAGDFQYNKFDSRGYLLSTTGWTGSMTYVHAHSNGQINNANNFTGQITQTTVGARARLYATSFSGRIIYSSFDNYSFAYLERSAMDIFGVSVLNAYFYVRDAVAGSRVRDLTIMSYARFYGQFMGATGYVNRCTLQSYALIYARNGFAGTLRYCNVSSNSYFLADTMTGVYQRSEAHAYARVRLTQAGGTSSNNNYTTNSYTIAAATSNDVQGY